MIFGSVVLCVAYMYSLYKEITIFVSWTGGPLTSLYVCIFLVMLWWVTPPVLLNWESSLHSVFQMILWHSILLSLAKITQITATGYWIKTIGEVYSSLKLVTQVPGVPTAAIIVFPLIIVIAAENRWYLTCQILPIFLVVKFSVTSDLNHQVCHRL